jgi:CRP/FNR family transcriptional regulator, cyclic AMP receptor protein
MPSMPDLSMFANSADTKDYPAGHRFFTEGDAGDAMYVVVSGEVEIRIRDWLVETIGVGGIFGEMALIDNRERSAEARAKSPVKVATIDQQQFLFLLQTHPHFSIEVMHVMSDRLRLLNEIIY